MACTGEANSHLTDHAHEVDAEPSLRAPSGIAEVGVLTRRLATGTTPAACPTAL
jgi:hypothetical protein